MKQSGELSIDTHERYTAVVRLTVDGNVYEKVSDARILNSQTVLPLIEDLLREHDLPLSCITGIRVATGPGSFTGLRVGLAIANTLSFILSVPVNGTSSLARAIYSF